MTEPKQPLNLTAEQKFEALKMRYEDHVELLRVMSHLDLRIFTGVLTIQIVLGGWLATNPTTSIVALFGVLAVDAVIATFGAILLNYNLRRRKETIETLKNINVALGFETDGYYVPGLKINAHTKTRLWAPFFTLGVFVAFIGLVVVAFSARSNGEQGVAPQSATRSESKSEGDDKPQTVSEPRPR